MDSANGVLGFSIVIDSRADEVIVNGVNRVNGVVGFSAELRAGSGLISLMGFSAADAALRRTARLSTVVGRVNG